MRSDLVFESLQAVPNRYLLCQLASKAIRKFHRPNARLQQTMNEVFERFGSAGKPRRVMSQPEMLAPERRRAA